MRITSDLKLWATITAWVIGILAHRLRAGRVRESQWLGATLVGVTGRDRRVVFAMLALAYLAFVQGTAQGAAQGWEAPALLEGTIKVTAEELLDIKAEFDDLVIIDTRPIDTANTLTIEGAITPSEQTLSAHTLASLTKDKFTPLVIFGEDAHSVHSYKAARQAVTLGYSYVFWFRGGFQEWLDKGMPVVKIQK